MGESLNIHSRAKLEYLDRNFEMVVFKDGNKILVRLFDKYIIVIGSLGQLLFYFQAAKILHNQSAENVSYIGFGISFFSILSWLLYGIIIKNRALIIVNIIGSIGAFLTLLAILIVSL